MKLKCKPTYNYQTIEFEYEIDDKTFEGIDRCMELYGLLIQKMIFIAPDQPTMSKIKTITNEDLPKVDDEPASEGQIKFLTNLGLSKEQAKKMTKKQAWEYIKEHKK